jgi:hypothetical protein
MGGANSTHKKTRNAYRNLNEKRHYMRDIDIDGEKIVKIVFENWGMRA